jgi:hypothetical protein
MKRTLLAAACILLLPALAQAAAYSATLSGDAGTGFASIAVDGDTIGYTILVSGMSPTSALLTDGTDTINLEASFTNGQASGSVTSSMASDIEADPTSWEVQVTDGSSFLTGSLVGGGAAAGTVLYHPVIASLPGAAGTNFVTDVRVLNTGSGEAMATIDYYREGAGGNSEPTATATVPIAAGEQLVVPDIIQNVFGLSSEKGGVIITADQPITAGARIYNDQTDAGEGTLGQYQAGLVLSHGWAAGNVIFLQNVAAGSGEGYRSNIGWFNPNADAVEVTFTAYDTSGTMIDSVTATAGGYEMQQVNVGTLFSDLSEYGDHYISYMTTGGENLFVYGSVVDNVNGDASYIAATP